MNDTPETGALVGDQHCACIPYDESCGQLAQLARKLERERDIAQIWSRKWKDLARALRTDRDIAKWERDELIVAAFDGAME